MNWDDDLATWPMARWSRRVACRPHRWHVQEAGAGPVVLLLHGAGASTHTWRGILPPLAETARVVAVDLPGQGFSVAGSRQRLGLEAMATDLASLLAQERIAPDLVVGHSAGGAIALRLAQILPRPPRGIIGINPALAEFDGLAGWLFPVLAKVLAMNPLTSLVFSRVASSEAQVRRLLANTGSRIDDAGVALFRRLVADRAHVEGTLGMMAQWRLDPVLAGLPGIEARTLFLTGANDKAVPPETSDRAAARMRDARVVRWPGLGHILHEEAPDAVLATIAAELAAVA